jgi:hypothetical protein
LHEATSASKPRREISFYNQWRCAAGNLCLLNDFEPKKFKQGRRRGGGGAIGPLGGAANTMN